jgi:hypothetical protein
MDDMHTTNEYAVEQLAQDLLITAIQSPVDNNYTSLLLTPATDPSTIPIDCNGVQTNLGYTTAAPSLYVRHRTIPSHPTNAGGKAGSVRKSATTDSLVGIMRSNHTSACDNVAVTKPSSSPYTLPRITTKASINRPLPIITSRNSDTRLRDVLYDGSTGGLNADIDVKQRPTSIALRRDTGISNRIRNHTAPTDPLDVDNAELRTFGPSAPRKRIRIIQRKGGIDDVELIRWTSRRRLIFCNNSAVEE